MNSLKAKHVIAAKVDSLERLLLDAFRRAESIEDTGDLATEALEDRAEYALDIVNRVQNVLDRTSVLNKTTVKEMRGLVRALKNIDISGFLSGKSHRLFEHGLYTLMKKTRCNI